MIVVELDLSTVDTALLIAAEDSTAQKVTLIVIGLILATLALAVLTVWYYRITDPGPRPAAGGQDPGNGPKPGWKARLSDIQLPTKPEREPKAVSKPQTPQERVSLEGGYYLDLSEPPKIDPPGANLGSMAPVDLRRPAAPAPPPLVSAQADDGLSFDEWLAALEASDEA